jgi:hypothetical protein
MPCQTQFNLSVATPRANRSTRYDIFSASVKQSSNILRNSLKPGHNQAISEEISAATNDYNQTIRAISIHQACLLDCGGWSPELFHACTACSLCFQQSCVRLGTKLLSNNHIANYCRPCASLACWYPTYITLASGLPLSGLVGGHSDPAESGEYIHLCHRTATGNACSRSLHLPATSTTLI